MTEQQKKIVVLVHGWSVHNTNTYGGLAARLQAEARRSGGPDLDIRQIWLGKYVSFRDEVQLEDVSRAFDAAVRRELGTLLDSGRRFACITHSTGGPVVRDWWDRFYVRKGRPRACPMSHLIMLAPANFGSALAQLGKGRLGRISAWFDDVEPGQGVLDWLELGSPEAWQLNRDWFDYPNTMSGRRPVFPFVLTGQSIDREFYDNVNAYTGELGSDGVVRVAAANLNATYVQLVQQQPELVQDGKRPKYEAPQLRIAKHLQTQRTAFAIIEGRAHSGKEMGILRSIKKSTNPHPTVTALLKCLQVENAATYNTLCDEFDAQNTQVQQRERLEKDGRWVLPDRHFIRDIHSMVIFRIQDDKGYVVDNFDLVLTAGPNNDPNILPVGFFRDRQGNKRHRGTLTYFLNHSLMTGSEKVTDEQGEVFREAREGAKSLGFRLKPHVTEKRNKETNLVHYLEAELGAKRSLLDKFLKPNQTTVVDIVLRRVVREAVFRLTRDQGTKDFRKDPAGPAIP